MDNLFLWLETISVTLIDNITMWFVAHLPKRVIYLAAIRVWFIATLMGELEGRLDLDITMAECLKRFEKGMYKDE